jgi:hypothetical protein
MCKPVQNEATATAKGGDNKSKNGQHQDRSASVGVQCIWQT